MDPDVGRSRVDSLRRNRVRPQPDQSLGFMQDQFKREVAKPFKQLGDLAESWGKLVPEPLGGHTRLESLSRGVLNVVVDSSTHLYELDQLLRGGLERELIQSHKGPAFRRVKLRVGQV